MKRLISAIALTTFTLVPAVGFAQTPETGIAVDAVTTASTSSQPKEMTFTTGDAIRGERVDGSGSLTRGERHAKISSLITVRNTFVPEMIKSVEDL